MQIQVKIQMQIQILLASHEGGENHIKLQEKQTNKKTKSSFAINSNQYATYFNPD